MICFTGTQRPTGGNINLKCPNPLANADNNSTVPIYQEVGGILRGQYVIDSTDFTKNEYQFDTARGV